MTDDLTPFSPSPSAPPVLQRAALERVLLRAAELQAASADVPDTLTEAELAELGAAVGISASAMRQALVEERMRVVLPNESGVLAQLYGPATFAATRLLHGDGAKILARMDEDLQGGENLKEVRRFPDRRVWGAKGGFAGAIRELTRLDGRGFPLARADEVNAVVVPGGEGRTLVRIEATLKARRASAMQSTLVGVFSGALVGAATAFFSGIPWLAAAGALVTLGTLWSARKSYQRDAKFTQLAIEQTLDRIEFGEAPRRSLLSHL